MDRDRACVLNRRPAGGRVVPKQRQVGIGPGLGVVCRARVGLVNRAWACILRRRHEGLGVRI